MEILGNICCHFHVTTREDFIDIQWVEYKDFSCDPYNAQDALPPITKEHQTPKDSDTNEGKL
jgi:hypothetical protein